MECNIIKQNLKNQMKEHEVMFIIIIFIAIIITVWIVKKLSKGLDFILQKLVNKVRKK